MYVAERDKRLKFVSGFSGHGLAVVTSNKAVLWTPGLYTLQANEELSCDWILIGQTSVDVSIIQYKNFISRFTKNTIYLESLFSYSVIFLFSFFFKYNNNTVIPLWSEHFCLLLLSQYKQ